MGLNWSLVKTPIGAREAAARVLKSGSGIPRLPRKKNDDLGSLQRAGAGTASSE